MICQSPKNFAYMSCEVLLIYVPILKSYMKHTAREKKIDMGFYNYDPFILGKKVEKKYGDHLR